MRMIRLISIFLYFLIAGCTSSAYQLESEGRYSEAAEIYESEIESQRFASWKLSKLTEAALAYDKAGLQNEVWRLAEYAMRSDGYYNEVVSDIEGGIGDTNTESYQISVVSNFADAVVPVLYARRPDLAREITSDFLSFRKNLAYYWNNDYIDDFQQAVNANDKKSAMQLYIMRLGSAGSDSYSLYDEAAQFANQNGFNFFQKQIIRQKESYEELQRINRDRPNAEDWATRALYEVEDSLKYLEMKQANLACYKQAKALYYNYQQETHLAGLQSRQLAQQQQEETLNMLNQLIVGASVLSSSTSSPAISASTQSLDVTQMLGSLAIEMQNASEAQEKLELQNSTLTEEMKSSALSEVISEMDMFGSCQALQQ